MLEQKITRLAAAFAAQIVGVLTAAPLDDLMDLTSRPTSKPVTRAKAPSAKAPSAKAPSAKAPSTKAPSTKAPSAKAPSTKKKSAASKTTPPAPSSPSAELATAALAFFAERGTRGATAQQVGERLAGLGLAAPTDVVDVLAKAGSIRDAGFRRAAGKNATAPVYVAT